MVDFIQALQMILKGDCLNIIQERVNIQDLTEPFELIYFEKYNTSRETVKRELFLKTGKGRGFLKNIFSKKGP